MQRMDVPAAQPNTWEDILHRASPSSKLLLLNDLGEPDGERNSFFARRGHRAIGVVYHPQREAGNYVPTVLPRRYDAFLYLDRN